MPGEATILQIDLLFLLLYLILGVMLFCAVVV
jgi:hypothetical protein